MKASHNRGGNVVDLGEAQRALLHQPAEQRVISAFTRTIVEIQSLVHHVMESDVDPVPRAEVLNQLALAAKLTLEANHRYLSAWADHLAARPADERA
jgi:hypothetical protein